MKVDVTLDGQPWNVTLEPGERSGELVVTVKDRRRVIDVTWIDTDTLSVIDGGVVRDIRIHRRDGPGEMGIEIGSRVYEAAVSTANERARARAGDVDVHQAASTGVIRAIKAPMPGRVVRVLVAVGERVAARQPLVVVEAMKMENELRAPRGGDVEEIHAAPGSAVETGAVLMTLREL